MLKQKKKKEKERLDCNKWFIGEDHKLHDIIGEKKSSPFITPRYISFLNFVAESRSKIFSALKEKKMNQITLSQIIDSRSDSGPNLC